MKAGLFGGAWEDYLDGLNEAFDKVTANSGPRTPGDASADAHLSVLMDDADAGNATAGSQAGDSGVAGPTGGYPAAYSSIGLSDAVSQAPKADTLPLNAGQGSAPVINALYRPHTGTFSENLGDTGGAGILANTVNYAMPLKATNVASVGAPPVREAQPFVRLPQNFVKPDSQLHETEAGESGGGYKTYGTPPDGAGQYGTAKTMQVITGASDALANGLQYTPVTVGNISLEHGEAWPSKDHSGHRDGLNFDVRPATASGDGGPATWKSSNYDPAATQRIVDAFRATGQVKNIFFNDPNIKGVTPLKKHDDHMHIQLMP